MQDSRHVRLTSGTRIVTQKQELLVLWNSVWNMPEASRKQSTHDVKLRF